MKALSIGFMAVLGLYMIVTLNMMSDDLSQLEQTIESSTQQNERIKRNRLERQSVERIQFYQTEIDCLAKNMYFEARGEGEQGQDAVAFVTINRVRSERYPDNVCDVVYQAKTNSHGQPLRNQCQFSWYCDGKIDSVTERVYNKIHRRAEYIYVNYYLNDLMKDTTDGATHYHSKKVNPYWSRHSNYQLVANIGQHVFYQPTY